MIMSIKGNTITAASLPRDTGRVPRPASMGGGTFSGKANTILRQLMAGTTLDAALDKFDRVIENLLNIEVDYHALIWFNGFTTLVDKIDPITVNSTREIKDGKFHDDPGGIPGVYFPKWNGYSLHAWDPLPNEYCDGSFKNDSNPPVDAKYWCRRALPYVRTRHGVANDDWVRSRRQQEFIYAAINATSSGELSGLVSTGLAQGKGKWVTNYPITMSGATDLYNALHGASLGIHVVFKPSQFASRIAGTSQYQLKLPAVRAWAATYLK
jgi:anionic cell wall polymer biosynthesis LytR-Cps2A-Psr (LCP) family protein